MNYYNIGLIDHINSNKLDNRKCNLRIVTPQQNNMNKKKTKNTSSKYIGVYLDKNSKKNKWRASITFNRKVISLGVFENDIDAAKARDIATKQYFGEYGKLNFN